MFVNLSPFTVPPDGILLVNKPVGPTSHDIVAAVRRATGIKRVGHAGTLDPFADGLLIVLVGRDATKRQSEFLGLDKTYTATVRLGATSDTEDCTGVTVENPLAVAPAHEAVVDALSSFQKTYDQIPSSFSAKKINGKKAYELARAGKEVVLAPKTITIHEIGLISYEWPQLVFRARVSSGTYIRALARDIGNTLGCGAYVETLTRSAIGEFLLDDRSVVQAVIAEKKG